jgi:hypothetical protein
MHTFSKAAAILSHLTFDEIREQLDLAGLDGIAEMDNEQVYSLAIKCIGDDMAND